LLELSGIATIYTGCGGLLDMGWWALWKALRQEKLPPLGSAPPVSMSRQEFAEAQRRFVEKHDKIVKPSQQMAIEGAKATADFGKTLVTFLVVGNVGGLTALLALQPIMRDSNQIWLSQQIGPALSFAVGLFLAVAAAVVGFLSMMFGVQTRWNIAHHHEVSIQQAEFGSDLTWAINAMRRHYLLWRRFDAVAEAASWIAFGLLLASGAAWTGGAYLLTRNVQAASVLI
jgi:hypothetical protein